MAPTVKTILKAIDQLDPAVFELYGIGEVEDAVVDLKDMGVFNDMEADAAAEFVVKEMRTLHSSE